nr:interleukin-32 isoform X1 [Pan paniscus]XP_054956710.1 interleukin-32 isoform X1 [Pan paniscus]XP_057156145.1 interleukin-32 isoform X1 [Pan paniscus]
MCFPKVLSDDMKKLKARMVMLLPTSAQGLGAWVSACDSEDTVGHLGPWRDKDLALWCQLCLSSQHQAIERFYDKMQNAESGRGQEMSSLAELEDDFKEGYLETVAAYYEEQHPELTPLLEKERDGLRCRGNRSPVPDIEDPATEEPGESFCDKVMRWFQAMLQRLQTWWQGVLAWVKEKVVALVHEVQALWKKFQSFCCSLSELFKSSFQSYGAPQGGKEELTPQKCSEPQSSK